MDLARAFRPAFEFHAELVLNQPGDIASDLFLSNDERRVGSSAVRGRDPHVDPSAVMHFEASYRLQELGLKADPGPAGMRPRRPDGERGALFLRRDMTREHRGVQPQARNEDQRARQTDPGDQPAPPDMSNGRDFFDALFQGKRAPQ